jgi:hypothetical protein
MMGAASMSRIDLSGVKGAVALYAPTSENDDGSFERPLSGNKKAPDDAGALELLETKG